MYIYFLVRFDEGEYKNGEKVGKWETAWQTLKKGRFVLAHGEYVDGKKEGEWSDIKFLSCYSSIKETGHYKKGVRIGNWVTSA